jgi:AraC-like DNA-binding protein
LPTQVLVPHAKPADVVHYRNLFKVLPQFDSEVCAIRFPAVWLDRAVDGADPERRRKALTAIRDGNGPDLLQQVYRALRDALLCGRSSGNDVASALSMHRRTLNRRLQECGTTFQNVLDQVRCEAARQLLCYSEVTLDDIAASLGYAGVSPFMRSFRRWTGLSPGRMRRQALKGRRDAGASGPHHARAPRACAPASVLSCVFASPNVPEGRRAPGWRVAREGGAAHVAEPSGKRRTWAPVPARDRVSEAGARAAWPEQRRLAHT